MKKALIIGIGGQDGRYSAELLLGNGYQVTGASRPDIADGRPLSIGDAEVKVIPIDLCDTASIMSAVEQSHPDEIYNFAALSSGQGMFIDPAAISEINGTAVARMLETIRTVDPAIRFCQASTSELFGDPSQSPQSEISRMRPRSPYGAAKLYAHEMVRIYREHFGLFACSAIFFNHESPRRDQRFVTRKVTAAAARIARGLQSRLAIGNLETVRDWGFAGDYVHAAWLMLQAPSPDDYVVATGVGHSVRDLCERSFRAVGLDYHDHIDENPVAFRASEAAPLIGDATKARLWLGWTPAVDFDALLRMMIEADLEIADFELMTSGSGS